MQPLPYKFFAFRKLCRQFLERYASEKTLAALVAVLDRTMKPPWNLLEVNLR